MFERIDERIGKAAARSVIQERLLRSEFLGVEMTTNSPRCPFYKQMSVVWIPRRALELFAKINLMMARLFGRMG